MDNVTSVSQVNFYIKNMFENDRKLRKISVKGEISNCKYHSSGHIYFTLKDASSALSCVMFRSYAGKLDFRMDEGKSVIVTGNINVYERDGKYQLYAFSAVEDGAGKLYEEYEKLKKRLYSEGLFDEDRKKKIPAYAKKIGVITSKTGAVIQDICNVSQRRNPYVQIVLYPSKVQGSGSAKTIIKGIEYFEKTDVDTIIIGRGGGSIEDLWEFNNEELAYAIFNCKKPVISAVGHETDTTISDYVSDLRAPTPSAAAELAVYDFWEMEKTIKEYRYTLLELMKNTISLNRMKTEQYKKIMDSISPESLIMQRRLRIANIEEQMKNIIENKLLSAKHQMQLYIKELKALSPLNKLESGYSYISDENLNQIKGVKNLKTGQKLNMIMLDGQAKVVVEEVEKETIWQRK